MRLYRGLYRALAAQAVVATIVPAGLLMLNAQFGFVTSRDTRAAEVVHNAATTKSGGVILPDSLMSAEQQFLLGQYIGIGAVLAITLILMLGVAHWIARRYTAPQLALYRLSRDIVEGDYTAEFEDDAAPDETAATMRNFARIARQFDRLETARRTWLVTVAETLREPTDDLGEQVEKLRALTPPVEEALVEAVADDQRRFGRLADDLQAVALADLGRLPVTFRDNDPRALIHNSLYENNAMARAKGVTLKSSNLPEYTIIVKWDGTRIEQLFSTLIENSLRYTPAGGTIELGLRQHRGAWELVVDDSAPGVDVALAQRLFEPFYRTGESVAGSGFGLATARAIVEAHHGRIEAGHSPLGGLRVVVTLPATPPTA